MGLRSKLEGLKRFFIFRSSQEKRVKYLRGLGMKIGERCTVDTMLFSTEPYLIELGDHVGIAGGTEFIAHDAGIRCFREDFPEDDIFGTIKIGNNVFIGSNCTILPNTVIGNNCIVGAGSVVRGTFPDNCVIIGNPAKVAYDMKVQKFMYRRNPGRIPTTKMSDPEKKPHVIEHFKNR